MRPYINVSTSDLLDRFDNIESKGWFYTNMLNLILEELAQRN